MHSLLLLSIAGLCSRTTGYMTDPAWEVGTFVNEDTCVSGGKKYRYYQGDIKGACQPLSAPIEEDGYKNECRAYSAGGSEYGDCPDEPMTAYSFELVIPTKINECYVYTDDECGSGEERVTLASRCNSFSAGFKSFKCGVADPDEGEEGDANNAGWRDLSCAMDALEDNSNDPKEQWDAAGATAAYTDMLSQWQNETDSSGADASNLPNQSGQNLSTFIVNYFHGPNGMSCPIITDGICNSPIGCGESSNGGSMVSSPAAYMILSSMTSLHQQFTNIFDGLEEAKGNLAFEAGDFTKTFTAMPSITDAKHTLDLLMVGLALVTGSSFNTWFRKLPHFRDHGGSAANAKDNTRDLITFSIVWARDSITGSAAFDKAIETDKYFNSIVETWKESLADMNRGVFSPQSQYQTGLWDAIKDGQTFTPELTTGTTDLSDQVRRLVYASTIPLLWKPGGQDGAVFIATSGNVSQHDDELGCESWHPEEHFDINERDGIEADVAETTRICDGDDAYWMVRGAFDKDRGCSVKRDRQDKRQAPGCYKGDGFKAVTPLGYDALDGTKWGGLTPKNIAMNAINAWKKNGNKNGWTVPDPMEGEGIDDLIEADIMTMPGIVDIPVCTFDEAQWNIVWRQDDYATNPYWPCDDPEAE